MRSARFRAVKLDSVQVVLQLLQHRQPILHELLFLIQGQSLVVRLRLLGLPGYINAL